MSRQSCGLSNASFGQPNRLLGLFGLRGFSKVSFYTLVLCVIESARSHLIHDLSRKTARLSCRDPTQWTVVHIAGATAEHRAHSRYGLLEDVGLQGARLAIVANLGVAPGERMTIGV